MNTTNFTREELAQYILHTAKDSVVNKIKNIVSKEHDGKIVAYTTKGKPLSENQFRAEVQKGMDDVKSGRIISEEDLAKEIENW
ncbi:hypothetical protein [Algibacter sp. 2305UL17-15]|uniref:hypothetical protein n=1 Tax=Algibacter sp. 2305UL17-15 TaxID=3231268 RepID=UPI00345A7AFC